MISCVKIVVIRKNRREINEDIRYNESALLQKLKADGIAATEAKPGADIAALPDGYISAGKIRNTIL